MYLTPLQRFVRTVTRYILIVLQRLLTRTEVLGQENLPGSGPYILAANHSSNADAVVLFANNDNLQFLAYEEFKYFFPANLVVNNLGFITISRGDSANVAAMKTVQQFLQSGGILALFPESGTWEKDLSHFKEGVAYLALKADAPIVPVGLSGTYRVLSAIFALKRPQITLHYGKPIYPDDLVAKKRRQRMTEMTEAVVTEVRELLTPTELERYDNVNKIVYRLNFDLLPKAHSGIPELNEAYKALAGLISKPNLFGPIVHNADNKLYPFAKKLNRFTPTHALQNTLTELAVLVDANYRDYLTERLDAQTVEAILRDVRALQERLANVPPHDTYIRVRLNRDTTIESQISAHKEAIHA